MSIPKETPILNPEQLTPIALTSVQNRTMEPSLRKGIEPIDNKRHCLKPYCSQNCCIASFLREALDKPDNFKTSQFIPSSRTHLLNSAPRNWTKHKLIKTVKIWILYMVLIQLQVHNNTSDFNPYSDIYCSAIVKVHIVTIR